MSRLDLAPGAAVAQLIDAHGAHHQWLDAFAEALDRQRSGRESDRILRVWGLSQSEAGRVFGVARQAVASGSITECPQREWSGSPTLVPRLTC